ncbi:hypothetical protein [Oxalicibacterium faecigallinarum]|uniref:Uncharacterized protein n=1 Tax=Oxalicibacterium faecigallinarum TaxID=573741 RepID=A0A8J3ASH7_9BURK|nr:hypothetical protein [Oxalicibacterium faecigallinarum]GGI19160.1 hypothetical protein GCM10008066_17690 [Oxalicibacterium faecigallinarum]
MTALKSLYREVAMPNHDADIGNKNKGTPGTNQTLDKNQGNRSKQLQEHAQKVAREKIKSP